MKEYDDDCIHGYLRDYGYEQYERHDTWCSLYSKWCDGHCEDYDTEETE